MIKENRMRLTPKQEVFISEYLIDFNATRAAVAAGYSEASARVIGCENLLKPNIAAEIDKRRAIMTSKSDLRGEDVVRSIVQLLCADPRELVEFRRIACRYCHGVGFLYQYTPQEFRDAYATHLNSSEGKAGANFDPKGGDKFNAKRDPHPDCPECFGDGESQIFIHDTRTVSSNAVALYAGVRKTSAGIEVLMQSKEKAIAQAARYLGMDKLELNVSNSVKAKDLSDDELAAIVRGG
jgi:phage terminase small subunit